MDPRSVYNHTDCYCSCWCHHRLHLRCVKGASLNSIPSKLTISSGTVSIFRYGAGPNGIARTLGQFMGASGATFGYGVLSIFRPSLADMFCLCVQLFHVRRQRHSIRLFSDCPTSLCERETKSDYHGQQAANFYASIQRAIIRNTGPDTSDNILLMTMPIQFCGGSASCL